MYKSEKGDTNTTRKKLRARGMKQLHHMWCYPEDEEKIKRFVRYCNEIKKLIYKN